MEWPQKSSTKFRRVRLLEPGAIKNLRATPTFHQPLRTENFRKLPKIKDSEETDITVKISSSRSIGRQVFRSNGWNQHKFLDIFRKSGNFDYCFSIEIDPKSRNQKKLTSQSKPAHRDLQTGQKIRPNGQIHPKFLSIFSKEHAIAILVFLGFSCFFKSSVTKLFSTLKALDLQSIRSNG